MVGRQLWEQSGLRPEDISTAFLYDHFTPFVLMQLEDLGFCGPGEAKDFATVERLSLGGELPINTSGGLLGEAYIHGMNGITECVRQLRGHLVQPGRRRRARPRHRRHRRADERPDPRPCLIRARACLIRARALAGARYSLRLRRSGSHRSGCSAWRTSQRRC